MPKLYPKFYQALLVAMCFVAGQAWAQPQTVKGRVTSSDDGYGLPGVNILEKGTTNGTVSNAEGSYSIQVKPDAVLVFSFVGYASQEVAVGSQAEVNIVLQPDVATLNEVVIVGYSEVKKSDATGSVAMITSKEFNKGVVNSPQELIIGKTAGVNVTSISGAPGNSSTIRIRGGASLNASNDPLIVIDGVQMSNTNLGGSPNILSTINPNDIESITVLKDASAAIYGARASNGVIIITTKRGTQKFKLNYSTTATLYTIPKLVDVYTGDEFRDLIKKEFANNSTALSLLGDANTNWQKEIYRNAFGQDHNVNISGQALKVPYRVSVGYNNTDGILKTYNYERTTVSFAADPSLLNDHLKISINVKGMINNNNFADQGAVGDAIAYDPTKPVYNGNTRWRGFTSWTKFGIDGESINLAPGNPVARLAMTDNTSVVKRSIGNIKFDYEMPFLKELHATLNLGYDHSETKGHNNVSDSTQWIYLPTVAGGQINPYQSQAQNQLLDFYLRYSKELKPINSKVEFLGGYSWSRFYNMGGDSVMNQQQEASTRINIWETEYFLISFFGQLNYSFKDKYFITATLREDGTSRFSPDNRWGLFPAAAFSWKISDENFLKGSSTLSTLKLRVGYGVTGQQDIYTSDYPYIATYTRSDISSRYPFGDQFYYTLRPDGYDRNIKWEETTTVNAALDFGLLKNVITGSLDFYNRQTDDLIAHVPVPVGSNFRPTLTTNVGSMTSKGVELNLSAEVISSSKMQWTVGYNVSYNQNKITQLNLAKNPDFMLEVGGVGGTTSGTIQVHRVGYPKNAFYVLEQIYDQIGRPIEDAYVDRSGDGIFNSDDYYVYKQPDPVVLMGINSRMTFGNWDFNFNGRASFGNYVYNNVGSNSTYASLYSSMEFLRNASTQADDTKFKEALKTRFSDYYMENASFFRMDNINLGYTMRNLYQEKLSVRIGLGVQNAFVITKYSGLDPEVAGGIDNNFYPRTRSFFLNLNVEF